MLMNIDHVTVTIETEITPSMDEDLQERLQQRRQGEVTRIYSNKTINTDKNFQGI